MKNVAPPSTLVVIAASMGGIEALARLLQTLPSQLPAAIAVVLHRPPKRVSVLVGILQHATRMPVKNAIDGEKLCTSTVYLAPVDKDLTVHPDGTLHFVEGPVARFLRSAANPLFQSAPSAFGANVVGVVLTGLGHDATNGVQHLASTGGTVIAQDPQTALAPNMPTAAIATGAVTRVLPIDEIGAEIVRLVAQREAHGNA